jgi:hypothetical protein
MDFLGGCNWINDLYEWYLPRNYLMDSVNLVQLDTGLTRVVSCLNYFMDSVS